MIEDRTTFTERMDQFAALKRELVKRFGSKGAARWMDMAAQQMHREAERKTRPLEAFPVREGSPESVL